MSTTPNVNHRRRRKPPATHQGRLRRGPIPGSSRVPQRFLNLYRNEQSWTLFRVALGCFGAALVDSAPQLVARLFHRRLRTCSFLCSPFLLPPAELESATDRKARELGAQTVVSGGEYQPGNAPATAVQLFISPSHTWAMDKNHEPLVIITTAEIAKVDVLPQREPLAAGGALGRSQSRIPL